MEVDNKTVIIVGVLLMGFGALFTHYNDLALAVVIRSTWISHQRSNRIYRQFPRQ